MSFAGQQIAGVSALQGIASIMGGVATASSARKEAEAMRYESAIAQQESERAAQQIEFDGSRFEARQTMKYAKSGVLATEGSPLVVLDETRRMVREEAQAQRNRGAAIARLQGQRATLLQSQGRNALLGGIFSAFSGAAGNYLGAKQAGLWGTKKTSKPASSTASGLPALGDIIK